MHSDLTTAIQLADLVAYTVSWGVRFGRMAEQGREELVELADLVKNLRYCSRRALSPGEKPLDIWSFTDIDDLRPSSSDPTH